MKERNRARKKQKRLDAICEKVYNSNRLNHAESKAESNEGDAGMESGEKEGELRRSSRVRKAPEVLDSSPLRLRKRQRGDESRVNLSKKNDGKRNEDGLDKEKEKEKEKEKTTKSLGVKFGDGEGKGGWKSRLRSRANEGSSEGKETLTPRRLLLAFDDSDGVKGESKDAKKEEIEGSKQCELDGVKEESKKEVEGSKRGVSGKIKRSAGSLDRNIKGNEVNVGDEILHLAEGGNLHSKVSPVDGSEDTIANDSAIQVVEKEEGKMMENDGEVLEQRDKQIEQAVCEKEKEDCMAGVEKVGTVMDEAGNGGSSADKDACPGEVDKDACPDEVEKDACSTEVDKGACLAEVDRVAGPAEVGRKLLEDRDVVKMDKIKSVSTDRFHKSRVREGRRCGLCGRGNDGRPPKRLVKDFVDSDNEGYGESSSEEANYDMWDGFGDESGWMGRLLGPIHDRFGIAGVWVHQQCAVWSPEVYFAGLGCLKNVRAALFRGRALKCSRCGRPGATIGCRVDRCPRTFHLPCARSDSCVFDHRKFLIACGDHRHIFQPHGNQYLHRIKKLKNKKLKLEMKKRSDDAWRNDFEAEEKWLEKCGEDEEFLKREGKRLHRDILRIAPVYIGGSSGNCEKLCQGWESVAGLQYVVQCMKEVVLLPLLYPEFFSSLGLTPPRGVLLHGYPGTGKTLVVRALIGSCARGDRRIAYFARKGADCLGKYVGDAERQLRLLFQVAEKSQPSIIFFDEIDGLAPCRTRQQDQTHNSVVSTLLALMDGLKSRGSVIVIGATNRPDAIDPALRRPGRFDREIYFPLPSVEDRAAILSVHTQKWPRPVSGSFLKLVAQKTAGFAGADLQALCTQAAMTALRRNCDLQKIMSIAEKRAGNGCHLPLSSFPVKEKDWLDALACAPPPCSRREAGMAVNDVASSPLHLHLVPCLLQPLSHLLVSLYCDERVFLPPFLYKAAKVIKSAIISALEKIGKSDDFWWSYLPDFVKEADTVKQIETGLSSTGLLVGESVYSNSYAPNDDTDAGKGSELHKVIRPGTSSRFAKNGPYLSGRTSGFRALIAGHPKSGQRHLASCILYGFVGCVEIQKIDLATLSQEGHGDVIEGMTRILLKCVNKDLCVIYMPRIDLWAMEMLPEVDEMEYDISEDKRKSDDTTGQTDVKRIISELWNAFMEQVDSTHLSASLTILATSEVPSQGIPHRICQFFSSDVLKDSDSTPSQYALPRFVVQTDGNLDCDTVINSSAIELSHSLVQQYVQLVHDRTHADNILKEYRAGDVHGGNAEAESHNNCVGSDITNDDAFGDGDKAQLHTKGDDQCLPISKTANHQDDEVLCDPQEAGRRALPDNKTVKGKSSLFLGIYSFGYQVLLYPHFSELCWATSKLRDGPCTDISGPWKGWPFNSCIIRSNNSEKVAIGLSSVSLNNKEHSGVVRGLTAVGLLAYRGVYTSVREVAFEVRKVLELLAGQVSTKIIGGKDSHRFHRLLSQMAYLEDMVNSWAYTLQSLERDNVVTFLNPKERAVDHPGNQHPPECTPAGSDVCRPNISLKNSNELEKHEKSPPIFADSSEFATSNKNVAHLSLPKSEARIVVSESAPACEITPSTYNKSMNASTKAHGISGSLKQSKGDQLNCVSDGLPSKDCIRNTEELVGAVNNTLNKNNGVSAVSSPTCRYLCCSDCLCLIYDSVKKILIREKDASASCWTVEDVHDVVASCSVNLLSAVRDLFTFPSVDKNLTDENTGKSCACQDVVQSTERPHQKSSVSLVPFKCSFHSGNSVSDKTNACTNSLTGLGLKFIFRDNIMVTSEVDKDVLFHCKSETMCLGPLVECITMIKHPLD